MLLQLIRRQRADGTGADGPLHHGSSSPSTPCPEQTAAMLALLAREAGGHGDPRQKLNYGDTAVPYPNNALRNFARRAAVTPYSMTLDIDMVPQPSTLQASFTALGNAGALDHPRGVVFSPCLCARVPNPPRLPPTLPSHHCWRRAFNPCGGVGWSTARVFDAVWRACSETLTLPAGPPLHCTCVGTAYVLPAFELEAGAAAVSTKAEVARAFNRTVQPFYFQLCWKCQRYTDFPRWLGGPDSGGTPPGGGPNDGSFEVGGHSGPPIRPRARTYAHRPVIHLRFAPDRAIPHPTAPFRTRPRHSAPDRAIPQLHGFLAPRHRCEGSTVVEVRDHQTQPPPAPLAANRPMAHANSPIPAHLGPFSLARSLGRVSRSLGALLHRTDGRSPRV